MLQNVFAVGASLRTPLGELTALPRPHSWWGARARLKSLPPFPKHPQPALGLRPLAFRLFGVQAPALGGRFMHLGKEGSTPLYLTVSLYRQLPNRSHHSLSHLSRRSPVHRCPSKTRRI